MSKYSVCCDILDKRVEQLVSEANGHVDGIDVAHTLMRHATKLLKQCLSGTDDERDQAIFELLDKAKRELFEEKPAARQRLEEWRASNRTTDDGLFW
jgi:hypothetical protein